MQQKKDEHIGIPHSKNIVAYFPWPFCYIFYVTYIYKYYNIIIKPNDGVKKYAVKT